MLFEMVTLVGVPNTKRKQPWTFETRTRYVQTNHAPYVVATALSVLNGDGAVCISLIMPSTFAIAGA